MIDLLYPKDGRLAARADIAPRVDILNGAARRRVAGGRIAIRSRTDPMARGETR
jgi:hypothetical protein